MSDGVHHLDDMQCAHCGNQDLEIVSSSYEYRSTDNADMELVSSIHALTCRECKCMSHLRNNTLSPKPQPRRIRVARATVTSAANPPEVNPRRCRRIAVKVCGRQQK